MMKWYLAKTLRFIYTPCLMDDSQKLHQMAISAALSSNWEDAIKLNQQIIEDNPKNIEALNRLARAYFELGDLKSAQKYFETALKYDPYNQISFKFIKRIETFKKKGAKLDNRLNPLTLQSDLFIEEPGKTKLATLLKVAEPQKLSLLSAGTLVNLTIKNRVIAVTDQNDEYLGVLPDDLSHHLIRLINGGNRYQALIKTIKTNGLSILIRELHRSSRFKNQPSFLDGLNSAFAYSSDHIVMPSDSQEELSYEMDEEETS